MTDQTTSNPSRKSKLTMLACALGLVILAELYVKIDWILKTPPEVTKPSQHRPASRRRLRTRPEVIP